MFNRDRRLALGDGSQILVCDEGLWGRQYAETLRLQGDPDPHPGRVRTGDNLERERGLARIRLVVESTIANLKCQMRRAGPYAGLSSVVARAGMKAAATLAARGHSVTLLEREDRLGGQVDLILRTPGHEQFEWVTEDLVRPTPSCWRATEGER